MRLQPYFSNSIRQLGYELDPQQAMAVNSLDQLFQTLVQPAPATRNRRLPLSRFLSRNGKPGASPSRLQGRYLWGAVGRGKTWIMDLFYHSLPMDAKLRQHFQHFMRMVHAELTTLKGNQDPLKLVAERLAGQYRIICLDEFHVNDITDAMLLHGLLASLFDQGLVLVMTSNQHPDVLYSNGLQRDRFLPAIDLIKQHTQLLEFSQSVDYRQGRLQQAGTYLSPADAINLQQFHALFHQLAGPSVDRSVELSVNNRRIDALAATGQIALFCFHELCATARSASDYIEIANRFHTVFIEAVPAMGDYQDDQARRFVQLVDEFYDRKIRLLLCADVPLETLYCGRRLQGEFERTASRLQEMRSREYLERSRAAQANCGQDDFCGHAIPEVADSDGPDRPDTVAFGSGKTGTFVD